jgi:hypothetical protein
MSNTARIYDTACRFTGTPVQVAHHGHGVRITLGGVIKADLMSRFLNEEQANALAIALFNAGFGVAVPTPAEPSPVPDFALGIRHLAELNVRLDGRLCRLESTVFTGQIETRMAIMQERIGRLENELAALRETLRSL